ncbi:hypothetical protein QYF36_010366 [Acer negundo]|nr:hypothetical protein QYF36_010366 [Acer negundo]
MRRYNPSSQVACHLGECLPKFLGLECAEISWVSGNLNKSLAR